MSYLHSIGLFVLYFLLFIGSVCSAIVLRFYLTNGSKELDQCCLYVGKVSHTRLKGGATHHFVYPLFFSFIDLEQIARTGWSLWPIFKMNGGGYTFCSLDEKDHLQDWVKEQEYSRQEKDPKLSPLKSNPSTLLQSVHSFIENRTKGTKKLSPEGSVRLLAHLTYFGYCFNPISVFYCLGRENKASKPVSISTSTDVSNSVSGDTASTAQNEIPKTDSANVPADIAGDKRKSMIESIIVEVSNTPWIEQHSYMLDESVPNVNITRDVELRGESHSFKASWLKEFHVSPFMEMDYRYNFTFSEPKDTVWVQSSMTKLSTDEVWFTVSFELRKIQFTPLNLLYVLLFYPCYTRVIQLLIHYEAVKLFVKGVPTFNHPKGTPVEFGFGLTDKKLIKFISRMNKTFSSIFGSKKDKGTKEKST